MATRHAWVLNLDADVELGMLASGVTAYTPSARALAASALHAETLTRELLRPGDVLVDASTPPGALAGAVGRAFCPTPRALSLLRRAGAEPEPGPPAAVLLRVNGRAFATELGETLPGGAFVTTREEALAKLATPPPLSDAWRIKRAYGMAGRGQRVARPGELTRADVILVEGGMAEGGIRIEPHLGIETELAIHGWVSPARELVLGAVVVQRCDERGRWLATARATEELRWRARIEEEGRRVGEALREAGYRGPFGVDAFTYRTPDGELHLQPRSEINARFSMGFAVGLGPPPALG